MKKRNNDEKDVNENPMDTLYAVLCSDGEVQISAIPIEIIDGKTIDGKTVTTNYGKVQLSTDINSDAPSWASKSPGFFSRAKDVKSINILNKIYPTSCNYFFANCMNLMTIKNIKNLDTKYCTTMFDMFAGSSALTSVDLSNFDTSNVTNMRDMFCECSSLTNVDVSGFDTSKVTNMSYMFAGCNSLTNVDVSQTVLNKINELKGSDTFENYIGQPESIFKLQNPNE